MSARRLVATGAVALFGAALLVNGAAASDKVRIGYAPSVWDPSDFHGMMGSGIEMGLQELDFDYEFALCPPNSIFVASSEP